MSSPLLTVGTVGDKGCLKRVMVVPLSQQGYLYPQLGLTNPWRDLPSGPEWTGILPWVLAHELTSSLPAPNFIGNDRVIENSREVLAMETDLYNVGHNSPTRCPGLNMGMQQFTFCPLSY